MTSIEASSDSHSVTEKICGEAISFSLPRAVHPNTVSVSLSISVAGRCASPEQCPCGVASTCNALTSSGSARSRSGLRRTGSVLCDSRSRAGLKGLDLQGELRFLARRGVLVHNVALDILVNDRHR